MHTDEDFGAITEEEKADIAQPTTSHPRRPMTMTRRTQARVSVLIGCLFFVWAAVMTWVFGPQPYIVTNVVFGIALIVLGLYLSLQSLV
jgi:hypothetical protein